MRQLQTLKLSDVITAQRGERTYVQRIGDGEAAKVFVDKTKVSQILGWLQEAEREGLPIDKLATGPFAGYGCLETKMGKLAVWELIQEDFDFPDPEEPIVNHQFGFVAAY
jgi:hypothetical protein